MNRRNRFTAVLAAAAISMGAAVAVAAPAAAEPKPQVGKACPRAAYDGNILSGQRWRYSLLTETWSRCTYRVYEYNLFLPINKHYTRSYIKGGGKLY